MTRLEERSQIRRCASLRQALFKGLDSLLSHTLSGYHDLKTLAVEADLDKYYDIYEITRTDREDTENHTTFENFGSADMESLKHLKLWLKRLQTVRKLLLCGLLALEADGSKSDFVRWPIAVETIKALSAETSVIISTVDEMLQEGDGENFFALWSYDDD